MPPTKRKSSSTGAAEAGDKSPKKKASTSKKAVVGKACPELEFVLEDETPTKLTDLTKERGVVIFMYPRANTPGCTKQACGYRDLAKEFDAAGFDIYGLSYDKPKSQKNWQTKYDLPYSLLTDEKKEAIKAFGASKEQTKIKRSHIIIAKGGEVLDIQNQISPADRWVFNSAGTRLLTLFLTLTHSHSLALRALLARQLRESTRVRQGALERRQNDSTIIDFIVNYLLVNYRYST